MGCTASTTDNIKKTTQQNGNTINTNPTIEINKNYYNNQQNEVNTTNGDYYTEEDYSEDDADRQEEAAIKIQSQFRGYKTRKELKDKSQDINNMKEEESPNNTGGDVDKAATTIQAGFKGYKVRKDIKKQKSESSDDTNDPKDKKDSDQTLADELADIDLNDPEVEKAATKIQATFRGFKSRREPNKEDK
ncbi:neuromodulin-like isoform X1 [Oppia nitens]|uniref:neuromodulin-like isoform X1 n=1 Tax=Oppia nitens TaxID=1686743 RepID=UPI0023DAA198|nr:neuromodulin-like isoform X1 [Oppia nitens]